MEDPNNRLPVILEMYRKETERIRLLGFPTITWDIYLSEEDRKIYLEYLRELVQKAVDEVEKEREKKERE
jgi:hypothetical protein